MSVTMEQLNDILQAFNDHDLDKIMDAFADDGEFLLARGTEAHGERFVGKAAIRKILGARFEMMPDIQWRNGRSWIAGDKAVSEWHVTGTAAAGRIDCLGCDLWEFKNGKVIKKDTYYKQVAPA
ncbi:MAG: nuclear transport factor 2 family protein [Pseudomonadota bacterium]|jgi:hypothetical protein|nr:nuclear transport factor 2 family protein [Pseudomonadota bacterium]